MDVLMKTCPFCGGQAKIKHFGRGTKKEDMGVGVKCTNCGCGTEFYFPIPHESYEARKNLAIEKWNQRV